MFRRSLGILEPFPDGRQVPSTENQAETVLHFSAWTLNVEFIRAENCGRMHADKLRHTPTARTTHPPMEPTKIGGVRRPTVQPLVAGKRRLPDRPRTATGPLQSADVIADAQPRVRETASRQRARRMAASSREIAGSKPRAACQ